MENSQQAVKSEEALDTKALLNSLPENAEQRPKYVQILKQENGRTPIKSPAAPKAVPEASPAKNPAQSGGPKKKNNPKFFNKNRKNNAQAPEGQQQDGKRPFKVFLKKQEVIALPSTVAVREIPISTDNVNFFNGPTNYLSALHPSKIVIETNHYNSVEHYYQACKVFSLVGTVAAEKLNKISTPMEVKKETKKILREAKVSGKKVAEWREKDGVAVLKHAILHKFQQNEELKEKLLATDDKLLIQTFLGDTFFAAGATNRFVNGWVLRHTNQSLKYPQEIITENVKYLPLVANGKNVLGWILMGVREELRIASTA